MLAFQMSIKSLALIMMAALVVSSSNARQLFGTTMDSRLALVVRGGDSTTTDETAAVGVLDLRPDTASYIFGDGTTTLCDAVVVSGSSVVGTFPVSTLLEEDDDDDEGHDSLAYEDALNLQSAAAETIGTLCDSVCLLISYDPKAGKTVLHRTAGVKLAAVVNGMRQRDHAKQKKKTRTRLTLLLFCDGGEVTATTEDWDKTGAESLVERIRAFYAMGSSPGADDAEDDDPLESVDIVPLWMTTTMPEGQKKEVIKTVVSRSSIASESGGDETSAVDFGSLVQSTYDSMGGVGQISFDALEEDI